MIQKLISLFEKRNKIHIKYTIEINQIDTEINQLMVQIKKIEGYK